MQRLSNRGCRPKKRMMRVFTFLLVVSSILFFPGCKKNKQQTAAPDTGQSALYGAWAKGSGFGDTIYFMQKNGKHIMRYSQSFNPGVPMYVEHEYKLENGMLSVQKFSPTLPDYYPIQSFTWTQLNTEFKLNGFEIYMFMSSTVTMFTYRKI